MHPNDIAERNKHENKDCIKFRIFALLIQPIYQDEWERKC